MIDQDSNSKTRWKLIRKSSNAVSVLNFSFSLSFFFLFQWDISRRFLINDLSSDTGLSVNKHATSERLFAANVRALTICARLISHAYQLDTFYDQ